MKYYLLEKYNPAQPCWDVCEYDTLPELEYARLQGPQHNGELFLAKGLEMKIKIIDRENLQKKKQCRKSLKGDAAK